ncbi:MAG: DUF6297 family protein [Marmoricola sp.]
MTQAAELRTQIRQWRRGRADTKVIDAFVDAYVWVFAAAMLFSMVVSAVINLRRTTHCTSTGCLDARAVLPWAVGAGLLLLGLGLARLFGPVFASPAEGSWLLLAPVDRTQLLRGRLALQLVTTAVVVGGLGCGVAALAGMPGAAVGAFAGTFALLGAVVVAFAATTQAGPGLPARVLGWLLGLAVWVALLGLAGSTVPTTRVPQVGVVWVVVLVGSVVLCVLLVVRAMTGLHRLRRTDLVPGGQLGPSLSGALAALDLALLYDVLLARRWQGVEAVRPRRGLPPGVSALIRREVVRAVRNPAPWVLLAASVVLPYAGAGVGLGQVVVLLASLGAFLAGLNLMPALRMFTRSASLTRAFPFPDHVLRTAALAVPGAGLVLAGVAATPAIHDAGGGTWSLAFMTGVGAGLSAVAAATRWVTGRPPDWSRPLVTSPMGAVPTNLYGSVLRGFDVLVLTTGPMLIWSSGGGVEASIVLSVITLAYLLGRK